MRKWIFLFGCAAAFYFLFFLAFPLDLFSADTGASWIENDSEQAVPLRACSQEAGCEDIILKAGESLGFSANITHLQILGERGGVRIHRAEGAPNLITSVGGNLFEHKGNSDVSFSLRGPGTVELAVHGTEPIRAVSADRSLLELNAGANAIIETRQTGGPMGISAGVKEAFTRMMGKEEALREERGIKVRIKVIAGSADVTGPAGQPTRLYGERLTQSTHVNYATASDIQNANTLILNANLPTAQPAAQAVAQAMAQMFFEAGALGDASFFGMSLNPIQGEGTPQDMQQQEQFFQALTEAVGAGRETPAAGTTVGAGLVPAHGEVESAAVGAGLVPAGGEAPAAAAEGAAKTPTGGPEGGAVSTAVSPAGTAAVATPIIHLAQVAGGAQGTVTGAAAAAAAAQAIISGVEGGVSVPAPAIPTQPGTAQVPARSQTIFTTSGAGFTQTTPATVTPGSSSPTSVGQSIVTGSAVQGLQTTGLRGDVTGAGLAGALPGGADLMGRQAGGEGMSDLGIGSDQYASGFRGSGGVIRPGQRGDSDQSGSGAGSGAGGQPLGPPIQGAGFDPGAGRITIQPTEPIPGGPGTEPTGPDIGGPSGRPEPGGGGGVDVRGFFYTPPIIGPPPTGPGPGGPLQGGGGGARGGAKEAEPGQPQETDKQRAERERQEREDALKEQRREDWQRAQQQDQAAAVIISPQDATGEAPSVVSTIPCPTGWQLQALSDGTTQYIDGDGGVHTNSQDYIDAGGSPGAVAQISSIAGSYATSTGAGPAAQAGQAQMVQQATSVTQGQPATQIASASAGAVAGALLGATSSDQSGTGVAGGAAGGGAATTTSRGLSLETLQTWHRILVAGEERLDPQLHFPAEGEGDKTAVAVGATSPTATPTPPSSPAEPTLIASTRDRDTGITTSVYRNPDGSYVTRTTSPDGTQTERLGMLPSGTGAVTSTTPGTEPVFVAVTDTATGTTTQLTQTGLLDRFHQTGDFIEVRDPETGESTRTTIHGDGSRTIIRMDASGNVITTGVVPPPSATGATAVVVVAPPETGGAVELTTPLTLSYAYPRFGEPVAGPVVTGGGSSPISAPFQLTLSYAFPNMFGDQATPATSAANAVNADMVKQFGTAKDTDYKISSDAAQYVQPAGSRVQFDKHGNFEIIELIPGGALTDLNVTTIENGNFNGSLPIVVLTNGTAAALDNLDRAIAAGRGWVQTASSTGINQQGNDVYKMTGGVYRTWDLQTMTIDTVLNTPTGKVVTDLSKTETKTCSATVTGSIPSGGGFIVFFTDATSTERPTEPAIGACKEDV